MRVIPPVTITDAILTSSSVAEPGPGENAWNPLTPYAVGNQVYLASNHRRYERSISGTTATSPDSDSANWIDIGPTNRWAMFDLLRNTGSTDASPMSITITPGQRTDSIAIVGLTADEVTVSVVSDAVEIYSETIPLLTRTVTTWYEHLTTPFSQKSVVALFDLPAVTDAVITVELTRATGNVTCGGIILGRAAYLGITLQGAENDALNFSTIERSFDGAAVLTQRRTVPKTNQTVLVAKERVNKLLQVREALNAIPAFWSGIDDQNSGYFEAVQILGIYKRFLINMDQPDDAHLTLELEEV